jgi:Short C-terminal domain
VPVAAAPATPAAPPQAATSSGEVTDALGRLGDLRDRGIITPEEFEAKKAELLGRL